MTNPHKSIVPGTLDVYLTGGFVPGMPSAKAHTLSLGLHAMSAGLIVLLTSHAIRHPLNQAPGPITPLVAPQRIFPKRTDQRAGSRAAGR